MATQTYFKNIREHIITHLEGAEHNIRVCVAWLTDETILNTLVKKSKSGVHVEVITQNDEYNRAKASFFNKLVANNSKIYFLDKNITGGILHHKFCIIDEEVVITGSYNWSNNATNNTENIMIITLGGEDDDIIDNFSREFSQILFRYEIKDEEEEWDKALESFEKTTEADDKLLADAKEFYDKALRCWRLDRYDTALEFVNDAISQAPYDVIEFLLLRHYVLRDLGRYSESLDDIIASIDNLGLGQEDAQQQIKISYGQFINAVKSAMNAFDLISELNAKTQNNLTLFKNWGIVPHIFSYDELDPFPF